jgi:hypothetical protein
MGSRTEFIVIDSTEPILWMAIATASLGAFLLGRAVGRRAVHVRGKHAFAQAALDLIILLPILLVLEVGLLSIGFAVRTGGATACLPLVRQLLLIPVAVGVLTAVVAWHQARVPAHA